MTSTPATQLTSTLDVTTAPTASAPVTPTLDLDTIATRFARHGVAAVESDLRVVAAHAALNGVTAPSVGAMLDTTAPQVVRARAFSHVARVLNRVASEPSWTAGATPLTVDAFVTVA